MTRTFAQLVSASALILGLCGSLSAGPITYDLSYAGGPEGSFATGHVTIESSVLTPDNFIFTSVPTSFISSYSLTFFNYPNHGPITFALSDLGAAFIQTDGAGNIYDFNVWSYDRIGVGSSFCGYCIGPYLTGIAWHTEAVADVAAGTGIAYSMNLTAVPEPSGLWLVVAGSLIGFVKKRIHQA